MRSVLLAAHKALGFLNRAIMAVSMLAVVAAAGVLTLSVVERYFLKIPTDWQDETAIFLLVGVTFLTGAAVQARRGHVGIEAVTELLSPKAERLRLRVADAISCLFCAFFSWKSWTLLLEAVVDGQTTDSTWGPPLWIPYSTMAAGMTLVAMQLALQALLGEKAQWDVQGGAT
jgi:TRAP-type C4-dicarboxylate transport system permease small subunit